MAERCTQLIFLPQNIRGKNLGYCFLDVSELTESESELSLSEKEKKLFQPVGNF